MVIEEGSAEPNLELQGQPSSTDGNGLAMRRNSAAIKSGNLVSPRERACSGRYADVVTDPSHAAGCLAVPICWEMAVEAQSGATRSDLYRMIDVALASWPLPRRGAGGKAPR